MRNSVFLASAMVAFSPLAAGLAYAQSVADTSVRARSRAEYDALGVRTGAFIISPQVVLGAQYNDNVLAADETQEVEDTVLSVAPSVGVRSTWSRHLVSAQASLDSNFHQDLSSEDRTNYSLSGEGRLDVTRALTVGLGGLYQENTESRDGAVQNLGAELVEYSLARINGSVGYTFNRVNLTGSLTSTIFDYEDSSTGLAAPNDVSDQDYRDLDEVVASLRGGYALSPSLSLVAQASANQREYDVNPIEDSSGQEYLFGVNAALTNLMRGEFTIGYFRQEPDAASQGVSDGLALRTNIEYFLTPITTITLNASRQNTDDRTSSGSAVVTSVSLRLDHELRRNVIWDTTLSGQERDSEGEDRVDEVLEASAGVTYLMNRNTVWNVGYRYQDWQSDGLAARNDFQTNSVTLSLTLRL